MKHLKLTTICLGLALTAMTVTQADAGIFGKARKKDRTEKTEEMKKPARFDNYPTMQFIGGTLTRGTHSGWSVGDIPLYLHQDCIIATGDTEDGELLEGRHATVMGTMVGGAISAYSIYVSSDPGPAMGWASSVEVKEAGANPNVGVIRKPAE